MDWYPEWCNGVMNEQWKRKVGYHQNYKHCGRYARTQMNASETMRRPIDCFMGYNPSTLSRTGLKVQTENMEK